MRHVTTAAALLAATPVAAATGSFFSLANTNFVVLIAFLLFLGVLVYFKVPGRITGMLDKRADGIRSDLDEARSLREEAQTLLASYERKQGEVKEQAERIVAHAREEARLAAEEAKATLSETIERRVRGAEDQIASARAAAVRQVRDHATRVAIAAAAEVVGSQMNADRAAKLIDESIDTVAERMN
jgi:F-type H+-transporting ATPase subunit b